MENKDNSPLTDYFLDKVVKERMRRTRATLRDGVRMGLISREDLGIERTAPDVDDYMFDDDDKDEREFGMPVIPVFAFMEGMDYEWLLMSLEADHAKVVLVRHFGMRGKRAARAAGFSSEWSLYRRNNDLQRALERQREHFLQ